MKAKLTILTLLFALIGLNVWAQDEAANEPVIIIWLNDGNSQKVLFDEMPVFTFDNGVMTLKGETTELSWTLESLDKFTFEVFEPDPDGIKNLSATGEKLDLVNGGTVYDLSGKLLKKHIKSLSELPKGVYIIKNGRVTTKVVRK